MAGDLYEDFERAVRRSKKYGGNPFHLLSDEFGWSPSEVQDLARDALDERGEIRSLAQDFLSDFDDDYFGLGEMDVEDETPFGTGD